LYTNDERDGPEVSAATCDGMNGMLPLAGSADPKVSADAFDGMKSMLLAATPSQQGSPASYEHDEGEDRIKLDETKGRQHHAVRVEQEKESGRISGCDTFDAAKDVRTKRVSDGGSGSGVLRYALHLRFVCPALRSGQREREPGLESISMPADSSGGHGRSVDHDNNRRRFYLYGDLRVVFPQRHSDSDEGKVSPHFDLV
jgi:hypothetical protein